MRSTLIIAGIWTLIFGSPSEPEQAAQAYGEGKFPEAANHYRKALPDYKTQEQEIYYNLGHCYLKMDSSAKAKTFYEKAVDKKKPLVASPAWNNIGVLLADSSKIEPALAALRDAMRLNPDNETARFNYELLLKRQQQEQQNQDQQQDQQQQDQQQQDQQQDQQQQDQQQDQRPKEGNQQQQQQQQQPQGGTPEEQQARQEQARMLLEAMNENEKKFIQELRKVPIRRPDDDGRPDW